MQYKQKSVILTKQEVIRLKNYGTINKPEFPKITSLSKEVFGYIDTLEVNNLTIYIMFLCDKNGLALGKIANTYFDSADTPTINSPLWLIEYKKDLLNRVIEDLENKKEKTR